MEYQTRLKIDERPDLSASEKERELKKSMKGLDHALARGEGSPWYRSFIEYMPLTTARKVSCPALILQGDKDAHIPVDHAYLVAKVMRSSGNDNVTVIVFKNHNLCSFKIQMATSVDMQIYCGIRIKFPQMS